MMPAVSVTERHWSHVCKGSFHIKDIHLSTATNYFIDIRVQVIIFLITKVSETFRFTFLTRSFPVTLPCILRFVFDVASR